MSELAFTLAMASAVTLLAMLVLWLVSLAIKNVSIVDVYWGLGFVVIAAVAAICNRPPTNRVALLLGMTSLWGMRLAAYLLWRNWGKPEDRRYAEMRKHHGDQFSRVSLVTVFLLQGLLLVWIALPLQAAAVAKTPAPFGLLDALGVFVWLVGLTFETVGDLQMAKFQSDPANEGRVMDRGLWRYTRHPNYFGDFCVWWGLYLTAAAGGAAATVLSPVTMSLLLLRVSGVTLLEKTIGERRPEYVEYKKRTSSFFPRPPRA
jgi:steroid 5-alpha reductase family enzyme